MPKRSNKPIYETIKLKDCDINNIICFSLSSRISYKIIGFYDHEIYLEEKNENIITKRVKDWNKQVIKINSHENK